jgi:hypothetical protein
MPLRIPMRHREAGPAWETRTLGNPHFDCFKLAHKMKREDTSAGKKILFPEPDGSSI